MEVMEPLRVSLEHLANSSDNCWVLPKFTMSVLYAFVVILVMCIADAISWTGGFALKKKLAVAVAGLSLTTSFSPLVPPAFADDGMAQQLAQIQAGETLKNQGRLDTDNGAALTRELQLKPYQLIARGIITLSSEGLDKSAFPLGYTDASMVDDKYAHKDLSKDASLIILGVGREGGAPLAAKKIPLDSIEKFPLVFSLETSDLLFPYTTQAWEESGNSKDTIAVSAFLTPGGVLAQPDNAVRVGFGLSDPVTMAGVLTRSTAQVRIQSKLDQKLYTAEEMTVLSAVDKGLAEKASVANK